MISGRLATAQRRLDLADQNEPLPVGAARGEFRLQRGDVVGGLHERVADQVGVTDDEIEVLAILVGERIEAEVGFREVEALLRPQLGAGELALVDAHEEAAMDLADDGAEELAVVERHLIVDRDAVEHLGQGAGHLKRNLGEGRLDFAGKEDEVANVQPAAVGRRQHAAGPHLRSADIHEDRQPAPGGLLGGMDVVDHARPLRRAVVGAIDAEDIGPGGGEIAHDRRIVGGFGGERHHDAADTTAMRRAEAFGGVDGQPRLAAEELPRGGRPRSGLAGERGQRRGDGVERGEHAPFEAAERGNAERHQLALERPQVAVADGEVVGEIERARGKSAPGDAAMPVPEDLAPLLRHRAPQRDDLAERFARPRPQVRVCVHDQNSRIRS